jgi:hypothetical protein
MIYSLCGLRVVSPTSIKPGQQPATFCTTESTTTRSKAAPANIREVFHELSHSRQNTVIVTIIILCWENLNYQPMLMNCQAHRLSIRIPPTTKQSAWPDIFTGAVSWNVVTVPNTCFPPLAPDPGQRPMTADGAQTQPEECTGFLRVQHPYAPIPMGIRARQVPIMSTCTRSAGLDADEEHNLLLKLAAWWWKFENYWNKYLPCRQYEILSRERENH